MHNHTVSLFGVGMFLLFFVSGCSDPPLVISDTDRHTNPPDETTQVPDNLLLPFSLDDLTIDKKLISPFGLIRHAKDAGHGHGGIDIPLNKGDDIFAPADGEIIENVPATDGRGGDNIRIKLAEGSRAGEAWVFLFEHISLLQDVGVGDHVTKGQLIGHSAIEHGANHLALEYLFNNLQFTKNHQCWVDRLTVQDRDAFLHVFNQLATTQNFLDPWKTAQQDGYYPYRGALNLTRFPEGPMLCYPLGTDVRVLVS